MNMKLMTVFAVASLAIAGVACSESKAKTAPESPEPVAVDTAPSGTLNLSLPTSLGDAESSGGTLNLNIGGSSSDEPRLIGSDQLNGVDFSSEPGPALAIEQDDTATDDGGDDIIRLQPN